MSSHGRLIFFEGPDGVGKSTIHGEVSRSIGSKSAVLALAFPGNQPGTLGKLVYDVYHQYLGDFGELPQASLQLLHVAAHIDAIQRRIRRAFDNGKTVLLDRFWWSTWVYAIAGGVERPLMDAIVEIELMFWGDLEPWVGFLLAPEVPYRPEIDQATYERLSQLYQEIAQRAAFPVEVLSESATLEATLEQVLARII